MRRKLYVQMNKVGMIKKYDFIFHSYMFSMICNLITNDDDDIWTL